MLHYAQADTDADSEWILLRHPCMFLTRPVLLYVFAVVPKPIPTRCSEY